ncbi:MAG: dTDP-4-dehydrorhamnose reductase [Pseudomonadota bacterium]
MTVISAERPIVVIGRSGQVAEALVRRGTEHGLPIVAGGRPEVDLTNVESLKAFILETRPSVVINAAAYTAVDKAETDADAAVALNSEGPATLAALCAIAGVPLVHVSTDFVFSGLATAPYAEDEDPSPLGVYGASKAAGEVGVRVAHPQHVIVRTSWVYGLAGSNFAKTMLRLGAERGELSVVDDQIGAPTFADDLADVLLTVAKRVAASEAPELFGTFHFSNAGQTTWCRYANAIFTIAGAGGAPVAVAKPIPTLEYPTPATRPPYSVLDCSKMLDVYGVNQREWQVALAEAVPALVASRDA